MNNTELLKIAQKHLGQGGAVFRKYCGLPSGAAWCNAFVDYIAHEGGVSSLFFDGKKETYCPHSIAWCNRNLAMIPPYLAMPMDIIYFDWDRNGNPNHIGFVRAKKSTDTILTIEGNTDGGRVAQKSRAVKYVQGIYRPHFAPHGLKRHKLAVDGDFGYNSIYMLQSVLGCSTDGILGIATVKALQKKVGVTADGQWGKKTSMAVQKMLGIKIDGQFGVNSVKALQNWINRKAFPSSADGSSSVKPSKPTPKPAKPKAELKSYRIEIDITNQVATIYGVYSDKSSKVLMSEFVSTARKGKTTPTGNFKIQGASGGRKAKLRTAKMESGKSYAEYLCRFHGAKCMHCVPYSKRNTTGHVYKKEFNKLGTKASGGCVRMPWKMAHYIYTKCPIGTPVKVFKGTKGKYPAGKPKKYTATKDIDPTYKK